MAGPRAMYLLQKKRSVYLRQDWGTYYHDIGYKTALNQIFIPNVDLKEEYEQMILNGEKLRKIY